jgi:drug/metabolite transporter (DMT)-like permease
VPAAAHSSRFTPRVLLAFFIIYFVWGSTYLAIRIAVATVPPLFAAGARFSIAGLALLIWSKLHGVIMPTRMEWRNLAIEAALMFLCGYASLFWAETKIPSGVASVLVATTPICMALVEIVAFKRGRLHLRLVMALFLGLSGVCLIAVQRGVGRIPLQPCVAILGAQFAWCVGTVFSKTLAAPESKVLTAGAQMTLGGLMLLLCSALAGELRPWPSVSLEAAAAILYMIVAGSLLAFTAYIWLLARMPATIVASYAYVNPVVALALGYLLGHETMSRNILAGTALVLVSVLLILRTTASGH